MKFFLFLTMFSFLLFPADEVKFPIDENGKIVFTEVVEVPNVTKDILYTRAYEWFAKAFISAQNVLQMQDKETGKLIGKAYFNNIDISMNLGFFTIKGTVKFTISLNFKDNKYKYEIADFVHEGFDNNSHTANGGALENEKPDCGRMTMPLKKWNEIKKQTMERILPLIESLKKAMTTEVKADNW